MADRHSKAMSNVAHDLVQTLSVKLDGVWRYDQYIEDSRNEPEIQQLFEQIKREDTQHVQRLREMIQKCVREDKW